MSTDAMRAALNEILNKEAVYGEVPGLQRPTEFALASYYWRVIGDMKRVARAVLAQPVSAEPVAKPYAWELGGRLYYDESAAVWDWRNDPQYDNTGYCPIPLYAHPPTAAQPTINAQLVEALERAKMHVDAWLGGGCVTDPPRVHIALLRDFALSAAEAAQPVAPILQEQPSGDAWGDGYEEGYRAGLQPRKPLTDEQIAALLPRVNHRPGMRNFAGYSFNDVCAFARAIERALVSR